MTKITKISIITSFAGLWLTSYLSVEYQNIFGFILIFSFGILHGANDLILINQLKMKKNIQFVKIIGSYLLLIAISVVLFTKLSFVALLLFILVSGYHFGEQHWQEILSLENKTHKKIFQFLYGMLILNLLFIFNSSEVTKIIFEISSIYISSVHISYTLIINLTLLTISSLVIYQKSIQFRQLALEQLFYLIVLSIIFMSSSLIWGFTIYFIFWHSIPSLNDQIKFLYGESTISNFKKYLKTAFVYWVISLIGIAFLYFYSKDMIIFDALFFSFLASITFPHFIVMLKMYEK